MHNYTEANHLEIRPDATFEKTGIAIDHFHELVNYVKRNGRYLGGYDKNGIIKRFFLFDEIGLTLSYNYSRYEITADAFNPNKEKANNTLELIVSKVELPENHHLEPIAEFSP